MSFFTSKITYGRNEAGSFGSSSVYAENMKIGEYEHEQRQSTYDKQFCFFLATGLEKHS